MREWYSDINRRFEVLSWTSIVSKCDVIGNLSRVDVSSLNVTRVEKSSHL